ncbi:MAG: TlpA disulfide reductase family protein [Acidimicrobiia bacterium]
MKKTIFKISIFSLILVLLIGTVLFLSSRLETKPTYSGGKVVGKLLPDVTLEDTNGQSVELRKLIGKRIVINFFNSWCIPCQEELPALQEFASQHTGENDFVFIGIVRDDSKSNIRSWMKNNKVPFDVLFDPDDKASIAFGTTGQPETYAINPDGRVVGSILSQANLTSLEELLSATKS